jgi:hypothetical protein
LCFFYIAKSDFKDKIKIFKEILLLATDDQRYCYFVTSGESQAMETKREKYFDRLKNYDENTLVYRSYVHKVPEDSTIKKVIYLLYLYQEIEKKSSSPNTKFHVIFNSQDDLEIFIEISRLFDTNLDFKDNKTAIVNSLNSKIKTYLLLRKDYPFSWLDEKLPLFVSKERNNGMEAIRFITLSNDVKKNIMAILHGAKLTIMIVDFPNLDSVSVYSIIYTL